MATIIMPRPVNCRLPTDGEPALGLLLPLCLVCMRARLPRMEPQSRSRLATRACRVRTFRSAYPSSAPVSSSARFMHNTSRYHTVQRRSAARASVRTPSRASSEHAARAAKSERWYEYQRDDAGTRGYRTYARVHLEPGTRKHVAVATIRHFAR